MFPFTNSLVKAVYASNVRDVYVPILIVESYNANNDCYILQPMTKVSITALLIFQLT